MDDYEDDYIEEDLLDEDLSDEEIDDISTEYSDDDFSYSQNSFNPYGGFNPNDVNSIKQRINNRKVINENQVNKNTGVNNSLEKNSELENRNELTEGESESSNQNSEEKKESNTTDQKENNEGKKESSKEKVVEGITQKVISKKIGKGIKIKIAMSVGSVLLWLMFIILAISAIGAIFLTVSTAITGAKMPDLFGTNSSSGEYTNISNDNFLWPIGSKETTESNGVTLALGTPSTTKITSKYGMRIHPKSGVRKMHNGIDIGGVGKVGTTNVIAAKSGVVTDVVKGCISYGNAGCGGGYGNYIKISHRDGKYTLYAHLHQNTITVKKNDNVVAGQVIAKAGSSGNSDGAHLHFEVRTNSSNRTNPLNYVDPKNPRPTTQVSLN